MPLLELEPKTLCPLNVVATVFAHLINESPLAISDIVLELPSQHFGLLGSTHSTNPSVTILGPFA